MNPLVFRFALLIELSYRADFIPAEPATGQSILQRSQLENNAAKFSRMRRPEKHCYMGTVILELVEAHDIEEQYLEIEEEEDAK